MSETIHFRMSNRPPVDFGDLPPVVCFKDYPPLPGEGSRAYRDRVQLEILKEIYTPKPSLLDRIRAWVSK